MFSDKIVYSVFECDLDDMFDYDKTKPLFVSEPMRLDQAHLFAYEAWLADKTKAFNVMDWRGDCRGGYSVNDKDE